MEQFDAVIIGTGQAGVPLAARLAEQGKQVAILERHRVGGSCVNYGCTPSKTLIASARIAHHVRCAADWGIHSGEVRIDYPAVIKRVRELVSASNSKITTRFEDNPNITLIRAEGRFSGSVDGLHVVIAGDREICAPQVFINTGTRGQVPPIDGLDDVPYLNNETIFDLDVLPEHLILIGGGYISLELGQAYRRLGSRVTVIEAAAAMLEREDLDIAAAVTEFLKAEGIDILTDTKVTSARRDGAGVIVTVAHGDQLREIGGSHVLVAAGRTPNSDALALETVGVKTDEKGYILTDGQMRTNINGIYAIGDVNGRGAFTHTSYQDYEIVWDHLNGGTRSADGRIMTYAMYLDPPLGRVGMNEKEARKAGKSVLVNTWAMADISRAKEQGETRGMIKVVVDAGTDQILGATVLGFQGDDVVQVFSYFMHTGAPYQVMRDALPIHPTISEMIPTVLGKLKPMED